jgi:hypothetical protein
MTGSALRFPAVFSPNGSANLEVIVSRVLDYSCRYSRRLKIQTSDRMREKVRA